MVVSELDLSKFKEQIKQMALDLGADLVGVGSQERLKDAPPSGSMSYSLPGAQSCIIWVYGNPIEAIEDYFSKKDRMGAKLLKWSAYTNAWKHAQKITEFIEKNSEYKAFPVIPNYMYRKVDGKPFNYVQQNMGYPDFSLRYGAVAAGLGHLGWSGSVITKEFGGCCYLGGVLTTAPLEPDPMAKEYHCDRCKLCVKACTAGFFHPTKEDDAYPVVIGGYKQTTGKREAIGRCGFTCMGVIGESEDGKWGTWAAQHICTKNDPDEVWLDPKHRAKMWYTVFDDENTPKKLRKHSKKILQSFQEGGMAENVAYTTLEDMNPRCGNCSYVCAADPKKKAELYKMLTTSGKVYVDDEGREYVEQINEKGEKIVFYPPSQKESKYTKDCS